MPEPAFGYVLIALAGYANPDDVCYPGYATQLADTAYPSKQTITGALKYWRAIGVLTWAKGSPLALALPTWCIQKTSS